MSADDKRSDEETLPVDTEATEPQRVTSDEVAAQQTEAGREAPDGSAGDDVASGDKPL